MRGEGGGRVGGIANPIPVEITERENMQDLNRNIHCFCQISLSSARLLAVSDNFITT